MPTPREPDELFEPERYELSEEPLYRFELNRREFLGSAGAGLLITTTGSLACGQNSGANARDEDSLAARLHIGEDGAVTIMTSKVEVGQGSRTQITQAAAEEMHLPTEAIQLVMADTDLVPDDGSTAGSRTTPSTVPAVRKAAAAAREILVRTAAETWGLEPATLQVRDGVVSNPDGKRKFSYADLAQSKNLAAAYEAAPPEHVAVTPVDGWQVLGQSLNRIDGRDIVTGAHRYPSDIVRPGMLYGKVLRPPSYGATLVEVDLAPAEKMDGVTAVRDGNFAGCVAPTSRQAQQAVDAIARTARWETPEQPSGNELFSYLKQHAVREGEGRRRPRGRTKGSVEDGLAQATKVLSETYKVPYIQHAPMEPRAAVAEWKDGRLTVWTGTQRPNGVRRQLLEAFHLAEDKVRVVVPDTGGGFGGKHTGEVAIEAARLAKEARHPVSLRWTRTEEFAWAYFRPAGLFEVRAGIDAQGAIVAWDFTNFNSGRAALESPYKIPHTRTQFLFCESPLREGSYRGIAATANNFVREAFMDELATAANTDPLEFRLANLDDSRLKDVLEAAAKRFDWQDKRRRSKPGVGVGLAGGFEKGSYVAACVEVEVDRNRSDVRVLRICQAYECGAIQNPGNLKAQVEGCIIQGLGAALMEEIRFENGRLLNGSFAQYPVPRFRDVPPIESILLDRRDLPSVGAGETPIIAVAPAIANAVFDATGTRVRSLPIRGET
jgi:isoquinoline 1-oxidoreductase